ncbi:MAG: RnfH family protein [Natronospirillum sp.]|uniref:RnfH family protein n=1 Tax=Natronospirillum sp. TaxID=2812955 RepID=UPI0025EED2F2|nr:RnfH family protein [Natronospirillum sp.]MCH8551830.1 RnfH family protein [Natronospirillum sp.]
MTDEQEVHIEVACATPQKQRIMVVTVKAGTTLREAVLQSRIGEEFPEIDVQQAPLGIFGKKVARPEQVAVEEGQRVEVYRPLLIDPKEARANRAAKAEKRQ